MTRPLLALALLLPASAADTPRADLLRLSNGELEGEFAGLDADGTLRWEREDGIRPLEFKTDKVRQIVLRGGTPLQPGRNASHVTLVNGDRIPAVVTGLDADTMTLETGMAGNLIVPRDAVVSVAPNPFGGRLVYAGPFSTDGWELFMPTFEVEDEDAEEEPEKEQEEEREPSWRHIGSKWYYAGGDECLRLDAGMPDRSILRFKLEWRSRPPIAIAFHADFAEPPAPEAEDEGDEDEKEVVVRRVRRPSQNYAENFGSAYVLNLRSSYATLHHCGFNEEGEPFIDQIRSSATNLRIDDTGEAIFEIRCDRTKGTIAFHVNGEFAMHWDVDTRIGDDKGEGDDPQSIYAARGGGIGFQMSGNSNPVRISDIVVAEWNGMPDSARSLESDESDVILLTNGTDRFSGTVDTIANGVLELDGRYARLQVPVEEIAEVHFARQALRQSEASAGREVRVHFQPLGRLSGAPGTADDSRLRLRSPLLGELEVDLAPAVILEFQSGNSFLNYWDEDL